MLNVHGDGCIEPMNYQLYIPMIFTVWLILTLRINCNYFHIAMIILKKIILKWNLMLFEKILILKFIK